MIGTNLPDPIKFNFLHVVRKQNHMKKLQIYIYNH